MRLRSFANHQRIITLMLGLAILFSALSRTFHPLCRIIRSPASDVTTEPRVKWFLEVSGAVRNPGIYTFNKRPTVYRAIQRAGGPTQDRLHSYNRSNQTIDTGMRLELRPSDPQSAQLTMTPMSSRKRLILGIPIQVNQAPVEDLAIVPGISDSLARRIVEYRKANGPFKTWSNLRRVKGIGPKKLTSLRYYLSLVLP